MCQVTTHTHMMVFSPEGRPGGNESAKSDLVRSFEVAVA